jgi:hypothetical protein
MSLAIVARGNKIVGFLCFFRGSLIPIAAAAAFAIATSGTFQIGGQCCVD